MDINDATAKRLLREKEDAKDEAFRYTRNLTVVWLVVLFLWGQCALFALLGMFGLVYAPGATGMAVPCGVLSVVILALGTTYWYHQNAGRYDWEDNPSVRYRKANRDYRDYVSDTVTTGDDK